MKRVIIVHGWDGHPADVWFPWLKTELEKRGYSVILPQMPDPESPAIDKWVPYLAKLAGQTDEHTYFIGHSMGCQTIIRYLETLPAGVLVGGALFVAGFLTLTNTDDPESAAIAAPWLTSPIDFNKVKSHTDNFIAIFSDNDEFVPLSNQSLIKKFLGAKTKVIKSVNHFDEKDNPAYKQIPQILEAFDQLASRPAGT